MIPNSAELKPRTKADYDTLLISRTRPEERTAVAVGTAYTSVVRRAAAALDSGQSVLIFSPVDLARAFVAALRMQPDAPQAFHFTSMKDAQNSRVLPFRHDDETVETPAYFVLRRSFQRLLLDEQHGDLISVVDFLDTFFGVTSASQADVLYLLRTNPDRRFLGFAHPATPLPAALLARFPVQLSLPTLTRDVVWSLLAYREVQDVLGATTLSVAHQVALHHAIAGIDVLRFRSLVEALISRGDSPASPLQAIAEIRAWLMGQSAVSGVSQPSHLEAAAARLREAVIEPVSHYARIETDVDARALDTRIPRGIALLGDGADALALGAWFAAQLHAPLLSISGAALDDAPGIFAQLLTQPVVIFIRDFDEALLGDGAGMRACLRAWGRFGPTDLVLVVAHLPEAGLLPPSVRRRFTLEVTVS
jgi:hypothetical protein